MSARRLRRGDHVRSASIIDGHVLEGVVLNVFGDEWPIIDVRVEKVDNEKARDHVVLARQFPHLKSARSIVISGAMSLWYLVDETDAASIM